MRLLSLLTAALLSTAALGQARAASGPATNVAGRLPDTPTSFAVTVSGSITDANGLPLPGATVWKANTREILAVTNAKGEFTLNLPNNAAVTLACGYGGFGAQQIRLRQPHRYNQFVISLQPVAPQPR